jgi:hypothetical protein
MLFAYAGYFKRVSVQVKWMLIAASIAKDEPVSLAGMHNQRLNFRP